MCLNVYDVRMDSYVCLNVFRICVYDLCTMCVCVYELCMMLLVFRLLCVLFVYDLCVHVLIAGMCLYVCVCFRKCVHEL